jgi:two-component system response regulator AtoC
MLVSTAAGASRTDLPSTTRIVLGRSFDCEVVVDDTTVSRQHAVIHADGAVTIEDLGSRNGTSVGGRRLKAGERAPLVMGMVIELGGTTLVLHRARGASLDASPKAPLDIGPTVADPLMQGLYRTLDTAARGTLPILILGETGTGKEVFAREVHARSPRAALPFLPLNCAALPDALLESELFGYEKGAFTGALRAKVGLLESADGGTVFLDEIAEMPASTQAKLLRVLESGEVLRLGSLRAKRLDVRLVSATNRDLETLIANGRFRADLFYRLNGFTFELPPLRRRPTEIRILADRFARDAADRMGLEVPSISAEAYATLEGFQWPGNVRELRTVIERAVTIWHGEGNIESHHFMLRHPRLANAADDDDELPPGELPQSERDRIVSALTRAAGNQKAAAKLLGLSLRTLINRIEQYGIARPRKR